MDELPKVRLSKDERWAVCFVPRCGTRFAERARFPLSANPDRRDNDVLVFGRGWVFDGLTWRMSKRVWIRVSRGQRPYTRRPQLRRPEIVLPVEVVCPGCGRRQVADPEVLRALRSEASGLWDTVTGRRRRKNLNRKKLNRKDLKGARGNRIIPREASSLNASREKPARQIRRAT
jgi:hypothetical protein